MMKLKIKLVEKIIISVFLLFVITACRQEDDSHEHSYSTSWTIDATNHWHAATCEHTDQVSDKAAHTFGAWNSTTGKRLCTVCSYEQNCEHTWNGGVVTTAATCTEKGVKTYTCTVCGGTKTEEIVATGHSLADNWASDALYHWHVCNRCTEKCEYAVHTFGEYISNDDATTVSDGTKTRTCTVCDYKETVTDEGSKIPEGFVKVNGGSVTGAAYTDNFEGVFPEGRTVILSSFYIGKCEVTQAQYKSIMKDQKVTISGIEYTIEDSPSYCTGSNSNYGIDFGKDHSNYPVENVTWYDAIYYCNELSISEGLNPCYTIEVTTVENNHITDATVAFDNTKNGYRLPTEAEWEYAARGGDTTKDDWNYVFSGADTASGVSYSADANSGLDIVGWYGYNNKDGTTGDSGVTGSADGCGTHEGCIKASNRLGIYDMSGNVWEWCYDCYGSISKETVTNPVDNLSGGSRVCLGGSWYILAFSASVSCRYDFGPYNRGNDLGFRICRNIK